MTASSAANTVLGSRPKYSDSNIKSANLTFKLIMLMNIIPGQYNYNQCELIVS